MPHDVVQRPPKRQVPQKGSGLAQQSVIEHSLCPLDVTAALRPGGLHCVRYEFTDRHRNRKQATASVVCPFGLSPNDELYLYGLLALTFAQAEPSPDFYATPHWCLRQLGIIERDQEQGSRYRGFREAIRRLAGVVYENDRFYDPLRGEHRQVAFGLLKYSLPTEENSSRAWHFVWDAQWFRYCEALAGSFTFDFTLYRELDFASRRLFLLLSKIFWRNDHSPAFEIRQLAVNVLGFSEALETKEIKQKLLRIVRTLLAAEVVALPLGVTDARDLFTKRVKGVHRLQLHRGAYFSRERDHGLPFTTDESPLVEPLEKIGFDRATIRRILEKYSPRLIAEWSDITLAAIERKIIKESPQAYFQHYIRQGSEKKTTPPDWWHILRKQERARELETTQQTPKGNEQRGFEEYLRTEAKEAFESVMQRLFHELREGGQAEPEARENAERFARSHFRNRFRQQVSQPAGEGMASLSDLLAQRRGDRG